MTRAAAKVRARTLVRDQLRDWNLDGLSMTTALLVSELIGNVVRHARGPIHLRLLRSRSLICEVSDGGLQKPGQLRLATARLAAPFTFREVSCESLLAGGLELEAEFGFC